MTEEKSRGQSAKIVATLGPATDHPETIDALIRAGADVFRLNFSHGTQDEHARRIGWVRAASEQAGRAVAILQDIQGPKMRIGQLDGGSVWLAEGAELTITTEPMVGSAERLSTTYPALPTDVRPGDRLLLADGRIALRVLAVGPTDVRCRVERGGLLGERQGINAPGVEISAQAVTAKDEDDLEFGLAKGIDYVALSFVRQAADVERARDFIRSRGPRVPIVAFTPDERVCRQLALWWGVQPMQCEVAEQTEAMIRQIERQLLRGALAGSGDIVLVVGAVPLQDGVHTNFIKVHRLGDERRRRMMALAHERRERFSSARPSVRSASST